MPALHVHPVYSEVFVGRPLGFHSNKANYSFETKPAMTLCFDKDFYSSFFFFFRVQPDDQMMLYVIILAIEAPEGLFSTQVKIFF